LLNSLTQNDGVVLTFGEGLCFITTGQVADPPPVKAAIETPALRQLGLLTHGLGPTIKAEGGSKYR